jgi:hypothetical protein
MVRLLWAQKAVTVAGKVADSGQKNTDDHHHQSDNRQKQSPQVEWHDFLEFGAHFLIAQACALGAADADNTIDKTQQAQQGHRSASPDDDLENVH